jgi:hypothetical protein
MSRILERGDLFFFRRFIVGRKRLLDPSVHERAAELVRDLRLRIDEDVPAEGREA